MQKGVSEKKDCHPYKYIDLFWTIDSVNCMLKIIGRGLARIKWYICKIYISICRGGVYLKKQKYLFTFCKG